ncbi:MAG: hypothetical protein ACRDK2_06920 [Solirubrobacteraceae bacterium]
MNFDVSRLRQSHRFIGGGGIALFILLFFFKWFGASASSPLPGGGSVSFGVSVDGWHSLTNTRWLLLITIIVALVTVARACGAISFNSPVQPSVTVAALGLLSSIFVLYRIIDHPHGGASTSIGSFSYGAKVGLYLAFVACLAILYGGYLAMNEEGTSIADVREQASDALSGLSAQSPSAPTAPTPTPVAADEAPMSAVPPPAPTHQPDPPGDLTPEQQFD